MDIKKRDLKDILLLLLGDYFSDELNNFPCAFDFVMYLKHTYDKVLGTEKENIVYLDKKHDSIVKNHEQGKNIIQDWDSIQDD